MAITSDWHIHSGNSCDGACMTVAELVQRAAEKGIRRYGLTDHVHTLCNMPDIDASRKEYLASRPGENFHFGVEVSCVSQWELDEIASGKYEAPIYGIREGGPEGAPPAIVLTKEHIKEFGIEYVVGGTHWPLYVRFEREAIIRDYHRQNMFLAAHPLVDIVAHPWWWMGHWQDADGGYRSEPWLDDFNHVPDSMHNEFAAAVKEHGTVVEINIKAMLLNHQYPDRFTRQYVDYLAELKSRGVALCAGSDCHDAHYEIDFEAASAMLESVGIYDDDLWVLEPKVK